MTHRPIEITEICYPKEAFIFDLSLIIDKRSFDLKQHHITITLYCIKPARDFRGID